jgi:type IV pilus assembly protein PilV
VPAVPAAGGLLIGRATMERTMKPRMNPKGQGGAMMLEALIGILIFSTGILALIGMQALAIAYASDAKYRADASFLANQVIADMWVNRGVLSEYDYDGSGTTVASAPDRIENWVQSVVNALPGSASNHPIVDVDAATGQVSVTVRWRPPNSEAVRNHRTIALVSNAN